MLKIKIVILLMFSIATAYSQSDTIQIKTSAQCSMCKKKLEHDIVYTKGVKSADLDLKTKQLMVIYNPEKISPEKIGDAVPIKF
jgi:mercuric ion binding protein